MQQPEISIHPLIGRLRKFAPSAVKSSCIMYLTRFIIYLHIKIAEAKKFLTSASVVIPFNFLRKSIINFLENMESLTFPFIS